MGGLRIDIDFQVDALSRGMMFVVTFVGMLVHIFSLAYMKDDEGKARYFAGLSIFMFSMTGIVLANNFAMMFIFWELVGVSSYLLIGHWYQKNSAAEAAKKAFLTNRIGDFGFMIGILMIWAIGHSIYFDELQGECCGGDVIGGTRRAHGGGAFDLLRGGGEIGAGARCMCGCRTRWKARLRFRR